MRRSADVRAVRAASGTRRAPAHGLEPEPAAARLTPHDHVCPVAQNGVKGLISGNTATDNVGVPDSTLKQLGIGLFGVS
jgi:hypothetical protein